MLRNPKFSFSSFLVLSVCMAASFTTAWASIAEMPDSLRASVEAAVDRVKPALVQIHVVRTRYSEGRELKYEVMGSGVVISKEGYVVTNHHVAGHATRLMCTFSNKEKIEADLVGTDPLTDIAVLELKPEKPRVFTAAAFGDSNALYVGQHVLAMGCPLALSHSVTLGIVSNTEMVMKSDWHGTLELDGENVGALVRWIAHDAEIYGGNSGGPLVNLNGEVVGINEIRLGLAGAIPGNLAQDVARELIEHGKVRRSWCGFDVQPLLRRCDLKQGILVCGTIKGSPAEDAGLESGDILIQVADKPIYVRFAEELPDFNLLMTSLPIGEDVEMKVLRGDTMKTLVVTPVEREKAETKEHELRQWGLTVRDLSLMDVKERKLDSGDGVLVTSVRPGGPAGEAKPSIESDDILVTVKDAKIKDLAALRDKTTEITEGKTEPTPVLTGFERKSGDYVTVIKVGIRELPDPALQVKKAWLPVETQVLTRDIAEVLDRPELTGFRITHVYSDSTAEKAGLKIGDIVMAVDGEQLTASAPEHYEELPALIRQYREGDKVALDVLRDGDETDVDVELVRAPKSNREMKRFRDERFEFTVRNISFFDKAREKWPQDQKGVLVDEVKPGSWVALGGMKVRDLIIEVEEDTVTDVAMFEEKMAAIHKDKPESVVFCVLRGIHRVYVELEPKWGEEDEKEKEDAS